MTIKSQDFSEKAQKLSILLKARLKICIIMHQKPDGDAMGAGLAWYLFLKKMGCHPILISPTNWAHFLNWLPENNQVVNFDLDLQANAKLMNDSDYFCCLDFNILNKSRLHNMVDYLPVKQREKFILIDHHKNPDLKQFQFVFSYPNMPSTCDIVYELIKTIQPEFLDKDIATCLYTGIMTDTGSFRFSSVQSATHTILADLLQYNIEHQKIHDKIFDCFNENRLRFLGFLFLHRLEVFPKQSTALFYVTKEDIKKYNIQTGDTEGVINWLFSIEYVSFAAMVVDRDQERKWSFRSRNNFDVSQFAASYFNGGGHHNAAGGSSLDSIENTITFFKNKLNTSIIE